MSYEVSTDDNGYEFVKVTDDELMAWQGVPQRFAGIEWCVTRPEMIDGLAWGDARPIADAGLRADLAWLSRWSKDNIERTVILCGPQGRGKTTYAAATLRRALGVRPKPKWVSWPRLVSDVADSWGSRDVGQADILGKYIRTGFLVVDDFGKELAGGADSMRDWQVRIAFELVNGRYERQMPTVFTTELDAETMGARLDRAITSRLVHEGRWIHLDGQPDHRLRDGG